MSDKRYIHIRNWDRFQHRDTTRNQKSGAPWIKDYVGQLHDADWLELTCAQRGILQGLRLMYGASRGRGLSEAQARTFLSTSAAEAKNWRRNIEALNDAGFLDILDSKVRADLPADRAQPASPDVDVEEKDQKPSVLPSVAKDPAPEPMLEPRNGRTDISDSGQIGNTTREQLALARARAHGAIR